MPTQAEIIEAMQFAGVYSRDPINTTGAPREEITYQFASSQPGDLWNSYSGWTPFTNAEKAAYREALDIIETFLNVDFVEVTGQADPDMNVGKVSMSGGVAGVGGYSMSTSGSTILEYDSFTVFRNTIDLSQESRINLILHEIGHALGLKHPFSNPTLPDEFENNKYTVMSYSANPDNGVDSDTMMIYDILALQDIWGAADYNTGNTTYTGKRTDTVDAIWDTGGTDHFDASGYTGSVELNLGEGEYSRFGAYDDVSIAYGTVIENASGGSGDDTIIGNKSANVLDGNGGRDKLEGLAGRDKLLGGNGRDILSGDGGADILRGEGGGDKLLGDRGNDKLNGGGGSDRFHFRENFDRDVIRDFEDDVDIIVLKNLGLTDVADALSYATEVGDNVVFDFGGGDILKVNNMTIAALSDDLLIA